METAFNSVVDKAIAGKTADSAEFKTFSAMKLEVASVENKDIVDKAATVALMLAAGETGVWVGATIGMVDAQWDKDTSVWSSNYVRTGFDKIRPYMDWAGIGIAGASALLNANGNTGVTGAQKSTAIAGSGTLLLASVFQKYLGATSTNDVAGKVGEYELNLAQIMASRDAYNEIQTRIDLVTKYHGSAQAQLQKLKNVYPKLAQWSDDLGKGKQPAQDLLDDIDLVLWGRVHQLGTLSLEWMMLLESGCALRSPRFVQPRA